MVQYKESYRKSLEEIPQLPLLLQSDLPLGCNLPLIGNDGSIRNEWRGQTQWRVEHGPATAVMQYGYPSSIYNALSESGERARVQLVLDGRWRYPIKAPEIWDWCDIDILPHDIHVKTRKFSLILDDDEQKFFDSLSGLVEVSERVRSEFTFAVVLNQLMSYGEWRNGEEVFFLGPRQYAGIVAKLRGCGNSYHDFFLWDPTDFELEAGESWPDMKSILELMNSYGWTRH